MRVFITLLIFISTFCVYSDTMENYMNISNTIPRMEIKADQQSQAWARSARNILTITNESIAETLMQANELAKGQGKALFCLPMGATLDANTLNGIIQQTYQSLSSQQSDKAKMTISQVAWLGVTKKYPCQAQTAQANSMEHIDALLRH